MPDQLDPAVVRRRIIMAFAGLIFIGVMITVFLTSIEPEPEKVVKVAFYRTAIDLPIPDGFCALSHNHPADKKRLDSARRAARHSGLILALFANCKELEAYRATGRPFVYMGAYQVPADAAQKKYKESRKKFSDSLTQNFKNRDPETAGNFVPEDAKGDLKAVSGLRSFVMNQELGLLFNDDTGVFTGDIQHWENEEAKQIRLAVVVGRTMVREKIVHLVFTEPYGGKQTFDWLLSQNKKYIQRLIAVNGG